LRAKPFGHRFAGQANVRRTLRAQEEKKMNQLSDIITKIAIPITTLLGIFGTAITLIISLVQIRLKSVEQTEFIKNQEIESELKLINLFTELMDIAHGRKSNIYSEKIVDIILSHCKEKKTDEDIKKAIELIKNEAFLTEPIGIAAQDAAIAAIYTLGNNHEILYDAALQGLESLMGFKKGIVEKYYELLKKKKRRRTTAST
jgi:hypothetical protein